MNFGFDRPSDANRFACPICGEGNTQRVSLVYAAGTTQVRTSVRGGDMLFRNGYAAVAGSTAHTMLAKRLAPPHRHRVVAESIATFAISFLVGAIVDAHLLMPMAWIPALAYAVFAMRRNRLATEQRAEWEKRFVCMRCGDVFVPPGA